jgi:hypothetical protein
MSVRVLIPGSFLVAAIAFGTSGLAQPTNRPDHRPLQSAGSEPSDSEEIALGAALAAQMNIDRGVQRTPETDGMHR